MTNVYTFTQKAAKTNNIKQATLQSIHVTSKNKTIKQQKLPPPPKKLKKQTYKQNTKTDIIRNVHNIRKSSLFLQVEQI